MVEALLAVKFHQEGGVVMKKNIERIQETSEFI
jgi:hypothetical protein